MSHNRLNSKCKSVIGRPLALSLMMLLPLTASAQSKVTGTVTDANGETVIGATVKIKGVNGVGTVTDLDGKFSINAKPGHLKFLMLVIPIKPLKYLLMVKSVL